MGTSAFCLLSVCETMPQNIDPDRDFQAQKAAYLRAQHQLSQAEIASILGRISQSHVSRLLTRAEEMGCLVTELHFVEDDIPEEALVQIHRLLVPRKLEAALQHFGALHNVEPPSVRVFDSVTESTTPQAMVLRRKRLARAAAGSIEELLRDSRHLGVTWGHTVSEITIRLSSLMKQTRPRRTIKVVPVCAELIGLAAPEFSSSRLAGRLNDTLNSQQGESLSLTGLPAYIPRRYKASKVRVLHEYISDIGSYQKIFAQPRPLIGQLDTLLTSVGSSEVPVGGNISELVDAGGIDASILKSLVIGDVGGILIAQPNLAPHERKLVLALNAMWTGIQFDHLRSIAARARDAKIGSGVIIAAIGRDKVSIILECIRLGLVNQLLIDQDLATMLEQQANESEPITA